MSDRDKPELVPAPPGELAGEPPVVARLVVEIRSDGSRTIARGAMEDVASGSARWWRHAVIRRSSSRSRWPAR